MLAPAKKAAHLVLGLSMQVIDGMRLNMQQLAAASKLPIDERSIKEARELTSYVKSTESMRGVKQYTATVGGYVNIPEDGVCYISSNLEEIWIDGKLMLDNSEEVKRHSRHATSPALAKGMHEIKAVFLGYIIGGWPSNWNDGSIGLRPENQKEFKLSREICCGTKSDSFSYTKSVLAPYKVHDFSFIYGTLNRESLEQVRF